MTRHIAWLLALALLFGCSNSTEDATTHLAKAWTALEKNDRVAAIVSLQTAVRMRPGYAEARLLLGRTLLERNEARAAVPELERAIELGFQREVAVPLLIRAMAQAGQAKEAAAKYRDADLTSATARAEHAVAMTMVWEALGDRAKVKAAVQAALAADPKHIEAQMLMARLLAAEGQPEKAWSIVEAALATQPSAMVWQTQGQLLRTWKNDVEGAQAAQKRALQLDPGLLAAHDELLSMHFAAGNAKAMREQWAALSKALPSDVHTPFFFAQAEFLEGRLVQARDTMQQILKAEADAPRFLAFAALVDHRMGALGLAQAKLERLLSQRPQDHPTRLALANVLVQSGSARRALEVLQPMLGEGQAFLDALAIAAEASVLAGDLAGAERFFVRAAKARPEDARIRMALAYRQAVGSAGRESLAALEEIARRDSGSHADLVLVAAHLRRGDAKSALAALDRLEAKQPTKALAPLMRGNLLMRQRDLAGARANYERAQQLDPSAFAAVAGLATVDAAEQKPQEGIRRLEKLLADQPGSTSTVLLLARLYQQMNEPAERITAMLGKFIAAQPQTVEPRLALVEQLLSTQQPRLALAAAQGALALHPDHGALLYIAGRAQLAAGDAQAALRSFRRLATVDPESPLSALGQAQALMTQKDTSGADQQLKRAAELAPKAPEVRRVQIARAVEVGNLDRALRIARETQVSEPHEAYGFEWEGDLQFSTRRWDAAAAAFQQALLRTRSTPDALKRHLSLLNAGKSAEAQAFADGWMSAWPGDPGMLMHLGDVALNRREWANAEGRYAAAAKLAPGIALAHNNLAWALLQQQKPGAVAAAERAVALEPKQPLFIDTLAAALAQDGQLKRAVELQQSAISMAPELVALRLGLARIALKASDKALAREQLDRIQGLAANGNEASEADRLRAELR